jgi:phage tail-like protein
MRSELIARLLPDIYQFALGDRENESLGRDRLMAALLAAMEELHAPVETKLAGLADYLDPVATPDPFLPYLSGWVDLDRLVETSDGRLAPAGIPAERLRLLISAASDLSRWRGTRVGMIRLLEAATGIASLDIKEGVADADGRHRDFHIRVAAPPEAESQRALIDRLVRAEKPAYVTYELAFDVPTGSEEGSGDARV